MTIFEGGTGRRRNWVEDMGENGGNWGWKSLVFLIGSDWGDRNSWENETDWFKENIDF